MHRATRRAWSGSQRIHSLLLVTAFLAWGCGGGSGGSPGASPGGGGSGPNLTGWWIEYLRDTGSAAAYEPVQIVQIDHTGSTLWMAGYPGAATSTTVDLVIPSPVQQFHQFEYHLAIVSANHVQGLLETRAAGWDATEDVRLDRTTPPTGTFSASGTLLGKTVSLATAGAYAVQDTRWTGEYTLRVACSNAKGPLNIYLTVPKEKVAIAGGVVIGPNPADAYAYVSRGLMDEWASVDTGIVIFSALGSQATGTFDFTMGQGGTKFTGAFDVPILITN